MTPRGVITNMPLYDFICKNKHITEDVISFNDFDKSAFGTCGECDSPRKPVAANDVGVYGTDKFSDSAFRDASEAAGFTVTNTKQIDKLESAGKMYAITNPSRHRKTKDERMKELNKAWREKVGRIL